LIALGLGLDLEALYRSHVVDPGPLVRQRFALLLEGEIAVSPSMRLSLGLAVAAAVMAFLRGVLRRRTEQVRDAARGGLLLAAGLLFTALTNNQAETLLGFLAPALVFLWPAALDGLAPKTRKLLLGALLAVLVIEGVHFDREVVQTRRGLDLNLEPGDLRAPLEHPSLFAGLHWATNDHWRQEPKGWAELIAYLRAAEGPFWLIGDGSPLYAACDRVSPAPLLWFHPGLTLPAEASEARADYERRLLRRFEAAGLRRIVIENEETWMGASYRRFPILAEAWRNRAGPPISVGGFVVIELAPR
jgi:hypothetical protein